MVGPSQIDTCTEGLFRDSLAEARRRGIPMQTHAAQAIVEAIKSRQGTRAESVAREHAQLSRRTIELAFSDTDMKSRVPWGTLIRK
jgi:DNA-binding GntR family transcriptional regulator